MSERNTINAGRNVAQSISTSIPSGFADYASVMKNNDQEIRTLLESNNIKIPGRFSNDWIPNGSGSATAKAYAMQGILKYHGLADPQWRTAFMPSISVNNNAAYTITYVNFNQGLEHDNLHIDNKPIYGNKLNRVVTVLDFVRKLSGISSRATVRSKNVVKGGSTGKGLGTSASAGAALATAAIAATLGTEAANDLQLVSCTSRLLSGSGCRSAVGGLALWLSYPGITHEDCFAVRLDADNQLDDMCLITVPIVSSIGLKTDQAHRTAPHSPFFRTWIENRRQDTIDCIGAISQGKWESVAQLAERDSMRLHGVSMTTNLDNPLIAWEPENISLFHMCHRLRDQEIPVYFSTDTGPSVVFLTHSDYQDEVMHNISLLDLELDIIPGKIAGPATLLPSSEKLIDLDDSQQSNE
jgi:diphosphomevalonate decarboxylase